MSDENTTIYICSDASLTYGPFGGTDKIIPQALPCGRVASPEEAEKIIVLVGQREYMEITDPNYNGRTIPEGYGPEVRYRYTLNNFLRGDPATIFDVEDTLMTIRDALRSDDNEALRGAFETARQADHGLTEVPVYAKEA